MRSFVRSKILDILGLFSSPAVGIHILNGHRILNEYESPETFRILLQALSKKVEFIRFEKAVSMIMETAKVDKPIIAFSFDDGFSECYTHFAPVLEEFGVNAAFFINPNFVEGDAKYIKNFTNNVVLTPNKLPMSWEEIADLDKRGHIIGAHTMDHYMINDNDKKELEYQIANCKFVIEDRLGKKCDYFAFPYGRLEHANKMSIEIACKHYPYVFSQSDYKNYFSFDGKVINRRHFEPFWAVGHIKYFLSCNKR